MSDSRPDFIGMFRGDPGLSMAAKGPLRSGERMNESSVNAECPAELLERAAAKLEELAFGFGAEEFWQKDIARADLSVGAREWAPVMGPAIAKPLVALLRSAALAYADYPGLPENLMRSADVAPAYGHTYQLVQDALVLATSILGEQS